MLRFHRKPVEFNSQAGVQKSNPQAGESLYLAISGKTLAKVFKINTISLFLNWMKFQKNRSNLLFSF